MEEGLDEVSDLPTPIRRSADLISENELLEEEPFEEPLE
jgi:hypothetical protein